MRYDWVLFDADHTLFDFDRSSREALTETLAAHGVTHDDGHWTTYDRINKDCWSQFELGLIDRETMRTIRFDRFFNSIRAEGIEAESFGSRYLQSLPTRPYFIPGAESLLEQLHRQVRMGIITNGLREVQRPRLEKSRADRFFEIIVVSGEIDLTKPDPAFFDYTHHQMGRPDKSRVVVVGDSLTADIVGGHGFGFATCWFNPDGKANTSDVTPTFEISSLDHVPEIIGL